MRVVAAMIRRCEGTDAEDQEEELVVEWAKAVKGWRGQAGNGKKLKKDAATMVKLLEEGVGKGATIRASGTQTLSKR